VTSKWPGGSPGRRRTATWLRLTGHQRQRPPRSACSPRILRAAGEEALACGNIGLPVIEAVAAGDRVIASASCQLPAVLVALAATAVGALLNIAPDHLGLARAP